MDFMEGRSVSRAWRYFLVCLDLPALAFAAVVGVGEGVGVGAGAYFGMMAATGFSGTGGFAFWMAGTT